MEITGIAIIALAILAFALISIKKNSSWVTMPMAFVSVGWLLGSDGLDWFTPRITHGAIPDHAISSVHYFASSIVSLSTSSATASSVGS